MAKFSRSHAALAGALIAAMSSPVLAQSALSDTDRISYTTAFDQLRRGQLDEARETARRAQDRVLLGQVEFERLFHDDHVSTYEELSAWLDAYADLPPASRVYALAMRRKPDGAPEPRRPAGSGGRDWNSVMAASADSEVPLGKEARVLYNDNRLQEAFTMGQAIGDHWVAGLAAWRLNDFNAAFRAFERVAVDPTEDVWIRAGAAFWTARAAVASARPERVQEYLRLAARWPETFYGQIALRQLGQEPVIINAGPTPYQAEPPPAAFVSDAVSVSGAELATFLRDNDDARRAAAFAEVGRRTDAREALKGGIRKAEGEDEHRLWVGLAQFLGPRVTGETGRGEIDAIDYPTPVLQPDGGYVIERSLVYAIARKESAFNPRARSSVGAYGMMQVMPTTAAELANDRGFVRDPERLFTPATNLKLGQAYVTKMLNMEAFRGDLLRTVASYNAGPGPMLGALRKLGQDCDPLLLIETIDVPQARDYVEKVMAAYWIYQRLAGLPLNSLDAVAGGATLVPMSLDYVPPPPAEVAAAQAIAPTQPSSPPTDTSASVSASDQP